MAAGNLPLSVLFLTNSRTENVSQRDLCSTTES
jgi:hypothetical protein